MTIQTFPCSLVVKDRTCWVIGTDEEALSKTDRLVRAGARVTVIAPSFPAEAREQFKRMGVRLEEREFRVSDLSEQYFVVYCPRDNPALTHQVFDRCREKKILLCAIDQAEFCDVANVSIFERGSFRMTISTDGIAPALAKKIRKELTEQLKDVPLEAYLKELSELRERLKREEKDYPTRRKKLIGAVDDFQFQVRMTLPKKESK